MKKNKYKLATHDFRIIDDKLFIVGSSNLIEMDFNESMRLSKDLKRKIKIISNVLAFDLSPDKKTFAVKNTSGHIAVYDYTTGELLLKNTCTKCEGSQIHYINDHQIISVDWNSKLIVLDITTNTWRELYDFGVEETSSRRKFVDALFRVSQNEFFAVKDYRYLYFIYVDEDRFEIVYNYQFIKQFRPNSNTSIMEVSGKIKGDIWITVRNLKLEERWELCVMLFNFRKREVEKIIRIGKIIGLGNARINAWDISSDFKKLVFARSDFLDDDVFILDLENENIVKKYKIKYVCQISYIPNSDKILLGTWEEISLLDESDFEICKELPLKPVYRNLYKEFEEALLEQIKESEKRKKEK